MSFIIKPIEAFLQKDLDFFSKMDPYVIIKIGNSTNRSKTHQGGGKRPAWSDIFQIPANNQTLMRVQMYDEDVGKDDLIGQGSYNLGQLYKFPGKTQNQYIDIIRNGKKFGRLLVSLQYNPGLNQGANMNNYQNVNNCNGKINNWGNNPQQNNWNTKPNNWSNQSNWNQYPQQMNTGWNSPTNYNISKNVYQNQNMNNNVPQSNNQNQGSLWGNVKPGILTMGLVGQTTNTNFPPNNQQNNYNNGWNGENVKNGWRNGW